MCFGGDNGRCTRAGSIARARAPQAPAAGGESRPAFNAVVPEVGTPHSHKDAALNADSAFGLSRHEPAIAAALFDADLKQRLDSEQYRDPARAELDCAAPILPGTAFTSSTLRAVNAHVAVA